MKRLGSMSVLLLCACGQPSEPGAQPETPAPSAPAPATAETSSLPDWLPDYPDSTRVEIPNLGAPGTDSRSGNAIAMETDATPDEVAAYYRNHFAAAGIPVRADTANAQGGLIAVGRDGEVGAMLTISSIGGRTRIAVIRAGTGH